jgi:hypothetical protein
MLAGCGGGAPSRESARDQATTATCARFNACAMFPSASYPSEEACELDWRNRWEMAWPASTCEGKIDPAAFQFCISAIGTTACNAADLLITLGKCGAAKVCDGASPDGG